MPIYIDRQTATASIRTQGRKPVAKGFTKIHSSACERVMPLACERVITCHVRAFTLFPEIPRRSH